MADSSRMEALLLLPRAVALAVRPLTDAGLEPVVFKGPAVAARYPEPGLRPMDDIDLLLPRADHQRAVHALGDAGWQVALPGGRHTNATVLTHGGVPSLFLEVHYALEGASQRVTALDPSMLWAMRQPMECLGTTAFGLPPAEELVVLAAHAGGPHHRFARLIWMADLAMIVGASASHGTAVNWDRVRAVAEAAQCVAVVGAALEMARRAGLDVPAGLFSLPARGRRGDIVSQLLSISWPLTHQIRASRRSRPTRQDFLHPLRPRTRDPRPGTPGCGPGVGSQPQNLGGRPLIVGPALSNGHSALSAGSRTVNSGVGSDLPTPVVPTLLARSSTTPPLVEGSR
jgi:hypothetical protein